MTVEAAALVAVPAQVAVARVRVLPDAIGGDAEPRRVGVARPLALAARVPHRAHVLCSRGRGRAAVGHARLRHRRRCDGSLGGFHRGGWRPWCVLAAATASVIVSVVVFASAVVSVISIIIVSEVASAALLVAALAASATVLTAAAALTALAASAALVISVVVVYILGQVVGDAAVNDAVARGRQLNQKAPRGGVQPRAGRLGTSAAAGSVAAVVVIAITIAAASAAAAVTLVVAAAAAALLLAAAAAAAAATLLLAATAAAAAAILAANTTLLVTAAAAALLRGLTAAATACEHLPSALVAPSEALRSTERAPSCVGAPRRHRWP